MKKGSNILLGLILIAVGAIWGLNALGFTRINIFFEGWWTLFIIVPCVFGLFNDRDKIGNIIGICIGVFLLLCCRGIFQFDLLWKLWLPAIIVLVGVKIILGNVWGNRDNDIYERITGSGVEMKSGAATFSSSRMDYTGEVFEGARLDAVFGAVTCDLRGAVINGDCVINASAIFGGIDIYVPYGVNVKVNSTAFIGGVSSGKDCSNNPANPYTLYVNATCLFGGVEIK